MGGSSFCLVLFICRRYHMLRMHTIACLAKMDPRCVLRGDFRRAHFACLSAEAVRPLHQVSRHTELPWSCIASYYQPVSGSTTHGVEYPPSRSSANVRVAWGGRDMADELAVFQDRIRKVWHHDEWWFSVVDVVGVLSDAPVPRNYWADMKRHVQAEGFIELLEKIQQLKMPSADGKHYKTDAGNTETILRIIQSIPSPKAEPFKRWLARVGTERLQEEAELTLAEKRLRARYRPARLHGPLDRPTSRGYPSS